MRWELSDEQQAYVEALRGWLADVAPSDMVREWYDGDRPVHSVFEGRLVSDGMSGVGIAEELGGQGGGIVELALTAEELGRAAAPAAAWLATVLAEPALAGRSELIEAAVGGGHLALALPAGVVPGTSTPLEVDADGNVTGTVDRVLGAAGAAYLVVPTRGAAGDALRLVVAGAQGLEVAERDLLDRSRAVADLRLRDTPSEVIGSTRPMADVLAQVADRAAVLVAADALGAMQRMLDMSVSYSLQREQFGVPIGSFQAVKHAAAAILVDVEAGRSGVYFAAASLEGGHEERSLHAAAIKAQVTAAAARAADTALTLHGAIGYTWEHDLHLFYKRARLDEYLFGSPASWNDRLADRLALT